MTPGKRARDEAVAGTGSPRGPQCNTGQRVLGEDEPRPQSNGEERGKGNQGLVESTQPCSVTERPGRPHPSHSGSVWSSCPEAPGWRRRHVCVVYLVGEREPAPIVVCAVRTFAAPRPGCKGACGTKGSTPHPV